MIYNCVACRFLVTGKILSGTLEIWDCSDLAIELSVCVPTIQIDRAVGISVSTASAEQVGAVVWADCEELSVGVGEGRGSTGLREMRAELGDLQYPLTGLDQFRSTWAGTLHTALLYRKDGELVPLTGSEYDRIEQLDKRVPPPSN